MSSNRTGFMEFRGLERKEKGITLAWSAGSVDPQDMGDSKHLHRNQGTNIKCRHHKSMAFTKVREDLMRLRSWASA